MGIRKTRINQRTIYTYRRADGSSTEIKPGENGVTEMHIKMLHALDDSEVYYELKNSRPARTQ